VATGGSASACGWLAAGGVAGDGAGAGDVRGTAPPPPWVAAPCGLVRGTISGSGRAGDMADSEESVPLPKASSHAGNALLLLLPLLLSPEECAGLVGVAGVGAAAVEVAGGAGERESRVGVEGGWGETVGAGGVGVEGLRNGSSGGGGGGHEVARGRTGTGTTLSSI